VADRSAFGRSAYRKAPPLPVERTGKPWTRSVESDLVSGVTTTTYYNDDGSYRRLSDGLVYRS
jgi:hypothetical protein